MIFFPVIDGRWLVLRTDTQALFLKKRIGAFIANQWPFDGRAGRDGIVEDTLPKFLKIVVKLLCSIFAPRKRRR